MDQTVRMFTERDTARMLAVSVAALRRWRREGRGPKFTRLETCVRYDLRELERFLAENSSRNKKAADSQSAAGREMRNGRAAAQTRF